MPNSKEKRQKTKYPGVYFIDGDVAPDGKPDRHFYIKYRKDGRQIFEKAGLRFANDMTPARANNIRTERMIGAQLTNNERREEVRKREDRWTISRLWQEYKLRRPDVKGLKYDENRFSKHISKSIGDKCPNELTPTDIEKIRLNVSRKHAPGTVKNVLELVRRIINWGVAETLCEHVSLRIRLPKVNNERSEFMTDGQMKKYLEALENEQDEQGKNFLMLALVTGMRKGELISLQWNDVDFQRGFITLRNPKAGTDQFIPLSDAAKEILEAHPRTGSIYVFPGRNGKRRSDFKRIAIRIKQQAGLPDDFRPLHGLRHNFASTLASSGEVDLYTLQRLMTHKSPQMTQRYAHLRDDTLRKASNVFGRKESSTDTENTTE